MLKKFLGISNVGRFGNYKPTGDVEFSKLTVIFGENGRGKSTITSIIRSLQCGDPNLISERKTLPIAGAGPSVKLRHETGNVDFNGSTWTGHVPDIEVYDAQFINDNIYSGLSVDHGHKRNLYRLIVGEQGVMLSKRVEELDVIIREANSLLSEKRSAIKPHILESMDVDSFVELTKFDRIDELIAKKNDEIASLRNASEIEKKGSFIEIQFPAVPRTDILKKTIDDLSSNAAEAVAAHSKKLDKRGENWIEQGVGYINESKCPFCGNDVTGNALVEAYRFYFSEQYRLLKEDIQQQSKANEDRFGATALLAIQNNIATNATLAEFWSRFFEVSQAELDVAEVVQVLKGLHRYLKEAISKKSSSPLEPVEVASELKSALLGYTNILEKVVKYNANCKLLNEQVKIVKARAKGGNLPSALTDLSRLRNTKNRHDPLVDAICQDYLNQKSAKDKLDADKKQAKSDLDKHAATIFSLYEVTMNDHLKLFGAEFLLSNTSGNYVGGKPNSSYNITINSVPIDVSDSEGEPCFKSALSGGDKSCLALAFFLARLDHDSRLDEKIIVFDDPMCSMDRFRSDRTVKAIIDLVGKAKQVVVLSHDPNFLRRIWTAVSPAERQALHVHRTGTSESTLANWDIVNATRSEYLQDYFALANYLANGSSGDLRDLARKIRVLLEENLRMRFPDEFGEGKWLGDFLQAIRDSQPSDVVHPMKSKLSEIDAMNDFSKKYHHGENPGASREPITDAELRNYADKCLHFLRGQ